MIRTAQPPLYVTALPGSPYDGQEVFQESSTSGIVRHLRYRSTAAMWEEVGGPPEPWITVGSGGAPAFKNSWTNYGDIYATAAFYKDAFGIVRLRGLVKSGSSRSAIFTLPAGYRPSAAHTFICDVAGGVGRIDVLSGGDVHTWDGSSTYQSLSQISFRA